MAESVDLGETDYREATSASEVEAVLQAVRKAKGGVLAIALESGGELVAEAEEAEAEDERR